MAVSIHIDKVVKRYGTDTVVKGLSLDIKPGELFTLLGPSGCGKTTLLRMIIGFNSIEEGQIEIDGQVINHTPVNKRKMGMVFQNYAIFPHLTVEDNIAFGLRNNNMSKESINQKLDAIMKTVQIEQHRHKKPENLSGGQQQRVALARALVIHPRVLLMDEPLSNLDAKLRVEMRNAIRQIQQEIGITTVYVTHDQEEALAISDRIAVMNNGVIQQIGKPEDIYRRPANLFVSQFIGTSNNLKGSVTMDGSSQKIHINNNTYSFPIHTLADDVIDNQEVLMSIRPQDFTLTDSTDGLKGLIESTMFLGIHTHYFIRLEDGVRIEVVEDAAFNQLLKEGSIVHLQVKSAQINVFHSLTEESIIKAGV
ncbi:ABC transporter ATP-binding protein [Alkalihalobacillus pseudalcaliphilus]|uniref:ABC transporter ATP-binding protein n=1 Tax=Alkalihalobacillus pseudalcaliphilus TaxID=79884 RepID=UPI00064D845B|nr:ABC transporter ATP-binding protein [Alkalihalobacillus pseudalcaliphilus]KMK77374.1 peptide ABC transporter substrate-binding protein [Alkalihalobacillus pseudalcaliphilus]